MVDKIRNYVSKYNMFFDELRYNVGNVKMQAFIRLTYKISISTLIEYNNLGYLYNFQI